MRSTFVAMAGLVTLLSGCLPSSYVVLLPDADGAVGKVTVSGAGGTQTLDTARTGVGIKGSAESFDVSQSTIDKVFGGAIEAQPEAPVSFMLYFLSDRTRLTSTSRADLPEVIAAIKDRASPDVSIIGHSDRYGDRGYNHRLALRRGQAIRKVLVRGGGGPGHCRGHVAR